MFSERLKWLRKEKGISQQELADKLCVVRQTISKWEKGLSLPDVEMLMKLAEVLGVTVNELLGIHTEDNKAQQEIIEQLMKINEQLVIKNRRSRKIWKIIGIILAVFILGNLLLIVLSVLLFSANKMTIGTGGAEEILIEEIDETQMEPPAMLMRDALSNELNKEKLEAREFNWSYRAGRGGGNVASSDINPLSLKLESLDYIEIPEEIVLGEYYISFTDVQRADEISIYGWNISVMGNEDAEPEIYVQETSDTMLELEKGMVYEIEAVWQNKQDRNYFGTASYIFYTK